MALAVSGGADSIYLLCALWANPDYRSSLQVWHFNHRVRGLASDQDAQFVREVCQSLQIPCAVGERAESGPASESELRQARNLFLRNNGKILESKLFVPLIIMMIWLRRCLCA